MITTTIVVSSSAYYVPGMSTTIAGIEHGASEVEVVAMRIAGVDSEVPVASVPIERTVEVAGCTEGFPLPVEQNVAHIQVATLPVGGIDVVVAGDSHEVIQVDFVGSLVLLVGEVQLVGHLVGEEQGLVACLLVAHCLARCCYYQHCYQGYHHLLHSCTYFNCSTFCIFVFTLQNYEESDANEKDFP